MPFVLHTWKFTPGNVVVEKPEPLTVMTWRSTRLVVGVAVTLGGAGAAPASSAAGAIKLIDVIASPAITARVARIVDPASVVVGDGHGRDRSGHRRLLHAVELHPEGLRRLVHPVVHEHHPHHVAGLPGANTNFASLRT